MSNANTTETTRQPWSPSGDDHLIFDWVKMQGKTQSEVASMLNIHQSTVSRVIQRYERWQAHAKARENGSLDHSERLRAQHWLTFERNELLLSSCLRIAKEMEGFTDVSKSTISRPFSSPSQEREVRTQHATIDRTGTVARFLRLAFRINMEQLKLAAVAEPSPADPLTDDELAEQLSLAATDAALISAALGRNPVRWPSPTTEQCADEPDSVGDIGPNDSKLPSTNLPSSTPYSVPSTQPSTQSTGTPASTCNLELETCNSFAALHDLHSDNPPQIAATTSKPCTCAAHIVSGKNSPTCITGHDPPYWHGDEPFRGGESEGGPSPPYNRCAVPFAPKE